MDEAPRNLPSADSLSTDTPSGAQPLAVEPLPLSPAALSSGDSRAASQTGAAPEDGCVSPPCAVSPAVTPPSPAQTTTAAPPYAGPWLPPSPSPTARMQQYMREYAEKNQRGVQQPPPPRVKSAAPAATAYVPAAAYAVGGGYPPVCPPMAFLPPAYGTPVYGTFAYPLPVPQDPGTAYRPPMSGNPTPPPCVPASGVLPPGVAGWPAPAAAGMSAIPPGVSFGVAAGIPPFTGQTETPVGLCPPAFEGTGLPETTAAPPLAVYAGRALTREESRLLPRAREELCPLLLVLFTLLFTLLGSAAASLTQSPSQSLLLAMSIPGPVAAVLAVFALWLRRFHRLESRTACERAAAEAGRQLAIYDDRVMETTARTTRTLRFADAPELWETPAWLLLRGQEGDIVFRAADLTPSDARRLAEHLYRRVPAQKRCFYGLLRPQQTQPLPVPPQTPQTPPVTSRMLTDMPLRGEGRCRRWAATLSSALPCCLSAALLPMAMRPVGIGLWAWPLYVLITLTGTALLLLPMVGEPPEKEPPELLLMEDGLLQRTREGTCFVPSAAVNFAETTRGGRRRLAVRTSYGHYFVPERPVSPSP